MQTYRKVNSINEFRQAFMEEMSFQAYKEGCRIVYENKERPDLGRIVHYLKEGFYDIVFGNYTVPKDFGLEFQHREEIIKFGIVYSGEATYRLLHGPVSRFTPTSFLSAESAPKGRQIWKEGQYFHGTEAVIYSRFLKEVIEGKYKKELPKDVLKQLTDQYRPLSEEMEEILHKMERSSIQGRLDLMYLDSKMLESTSVLFHELQQGMGILNSRKIKVGNRTLNFTGNDMEILNKAHELIVKRASSLPTIEQMGVELGMNPQKLKAGFSHFYHMTIWEFANSIRMSNAAGMLVDSDKGIGEIAGEIGYSSQASFAAMFKKMYGCSPKEYRFGKKKNLAG